MPFASAASLIRDELARELADSEQLVEVRLGFDIRKGGHYLVVCYDSYGRGGGEKTLLERHPEWETEFCGLTVSWLLQSRPTLRDDPKDNACQFPAYVDTDGKEGYCISCGMPAYRGMLGFRHNREGFSYSPLTQLAYAGEREARMMNPKTFGRWFWDVEEVYWYIRGLLDLPEVVAMCCPQRLAKVDFKVESRDGKFQSTARVEWGREDEAERFVVVSPRGMNEGAVLHEATHLVCELLPGARQGRCGGDCEDCNHTGVFLSTHLCIVQSVLGVAAARSLAKGLISNWAMAREAVQLELRPSEAEMKAYLVALGERNKPRGKKAAAWAPRLRYFQALFSPPLVVAEILAKIDGAEGVGLIGCFEEAARAFGLYREELQFLAVARLLVERAKGAEREIQMALGRRICEVLADLGEVKLRNTERMRWGETLAQRHQLLDLGVRLSRGGQAAAMLPDDWDDQGELVSLIGRRIEWAKVEDQDGHVGGGVAAGRDQEQALWLVAGEALAMVKQEFRVERNATGSKLGFKLG